MGIFLIKGTYSSGSWARMLQRHDDRRAAVRSLLESFDGSLDRLYWAVEDSASYAITHLPDVVTASAVRAAIEQTGAFTSVKVSELLTQDQLTDVRVLAAAGSAVYRAPGHADPEFEIDGVEFR